MTNRPKDVYTFKVCDKNYFESMTMHCPACDFEYTHLEGIGTDNDSNDGRLCCRLNFSCENGHEFTVRVHQHKGQTTFTINNVVHLEYDSDNHTWLEPTR